MREQLKLFTREIVDFTFLILSGFDYYQTLLISSNSSKKRPKDSSLLSKKKKKKKKMSYLILKTYHLFLFYFGSPGIRKGKKPKTAFLVHYDYYKARNDFDGRHELRRFQEQKLKPSC
ncbi:AVN_HP_G0113350.mRNA.1.CDS.1 [Saccharomyces cerevisiae]|nr:AVN_HP_G0001890.mRNA.1.CDS.1 [Saccharomyces cerevisiae]CAI5150682.1 AVN_HP_G0113350.mRNA.1.CDS.1 [Saccharomyces cerevisiae]CAI6985726.1 AVN_HP_G0001890.mRNA.1.CDS.1 [Saccharomyces cerevisiae]CAI6991185.1 AVN_HP_G0113350.mRNA.1.CDS.1 [Saccharomyces cerevisiae]